MGHSHKHLPDEDSGFDDDDKIVDGDEGFGPYYGNIDEAKMKDAEYEREREDRIVRHFHPVNDDSDDDDDSWDDDFQYNKKKREETFTEKVAREAREKQRQWREESWKANQERIQAQLPPEKPSILTRIWRSLFG